MIKQIKINKRGQLKIQEMAFVLVAVIFLFGILLLFFARFQFSSMQQTATQLRETRTVTMLRVVASLPELSCLDKVNCIDQDKLNAFDVNPNLRSKYESFWLSSNIAKITVEEVYPKTTKIYKIYDKTTAESTVTYSTFVPLCSESVNKETCKIAKLKITVKLLS